jgi:hypothetical protein
VGVTDHHFGDGRLGGANGANCIDVIEHAHPDRHDRDGVPDAPGGALLYSTDHHNVADGLTALPQDYAGIPHDVPRLGPPLPGDLGRPIVTAEGQSVPIGLDAEQQRTSQETEAARTSKVFAPTTAPVTPPRKPPGEAAVRVLRLFGGALYDVDAPDIIVAAFGVTHDPSHGVAGGKRPRTC